MTLADTSVWIEYLRGGPQAASLGGLLEEGEVLVHRWVIGELALGSLGPRRAGILGDLRQIQHAPVIADGEVEAMLEARALAGSGVGWVDVHLLASALAVRARLWTLDRPLGRVAARLGVASR